MRNYGFQQLVQEERSRTEACHSIHDLAPLWGGGGRLTGGENNNPVSFCCKEQEYA